MSIEPFYMLRMQACEEKLKQEMAREQISHPVEEYAEGSAHWETLWKHIEEKQRFPWPVEQAVNL